MKEKVSPAVAGAIIVVIIAVMVFVGYRMLGSSPAGTAGEKPPGMPPDAAAEFQKRMGSSTPTSPQGIKGAAPGAPGGGYLAPPMPGR